MKSPAKTFIILARQKPVHSRKTFIYAPVHRIAIAIRRKPVFKGSFSANPFWPQQFDLRQIRILRGGQQNVDFDDADNFRL